ncbi:MAG: hypothetical protein ACTSYN_03240, partial [Candidatus Heimdallarchaeaceae archaeon]
VIHHLIGSFLNRLGFFNRREATAIPANIIGRAANEEDTVPLKIKLYFPQKLFLNVHKLPF